jgi:hypothetical protein
VGDVRFENSSGQVKEMKPGVYEDCVVGG